MDRLGKDELFSLAIHLDLADILRLCSTSSRIEEKLCLKDDIWLYKLNREFPDYRSLKLNKSKKSIYELLHSLVQIKNELKIKESVYDLYNLRVLDLSHKKLSEIS